MSQKATSPKFRIVHDGSYFRPYYIEKKRWYGLWTWYEELDFYNTVEDAERDLREHLTYLSKKSVVKYV